LNLKILLLRKENVEKEKTENGKEGKGGKDLRERKFASLATPLTELKSVGQCI